MAYFTKPDFSRQSKQYSGTTAILSGQTNILEKFSIKNIEVDTKDAQLGNVLIYDGAKFRAANIGSFGSSIVQGLNLTYNSGLTYDISSGSFVIDSILYQGYTGGSVTVQSGQTGGSRFDVVYITSGQTALVRSGQTATNPSVPTLSGGELQIGIILIPINFTGGTGSTVIQQTSTTVFEFYNTGTGIQRLPNTTNASAPGDFSFAPMREAIAYGQDSVALGYNSRASGYSQTVVGPYNDPNTDDYFQVGNGTISSRSNAFRITTGGSAYVQNKLFVTNVEVETTGTSGIGQVLKFDGTKFKPQLETITGVTSITGGTSIYSSITNNTVILKSLSGGSNIFLTESSGTIFVNVNLSGVTSSGLTDIQSVAAGGQSRSIISGKTGNTFFLYPIEGSGGTQVILSNDRLIVFSDTSASTTGANIGPSAGAGVYSTKVLNELRFRRLSSTTPSFLTVAESTGLNELVLFTSTPPITGSTNATGGTVGVLGTVANKNIIGRTLSGTNRISLTQASDVITINSPIEVQNGQAGILPFYRSTSPVLFSSFTAANITNLTVGLATHTGIITGRTYTIPNVLNNADFVMTQGNQRLDGKKDFFSGLTIGPNGNTNLNWSNYNLLDNSTSPNLYYIHTPSNPSFSTQINFSTTAITSFQSGQNQPYTGTTFFGIDITTYTASTGTSFNSGIAWSIINDCGCSPSNSYYTGESVNFVVSGYDATVETSLTSFSSYTYSADSTLINSNGNVIINPSFNLFGSTPPVLGKSFIIEGTKSFSFLASEFNTNTGITVLKTTNIGPVFLGQNLIYSGSIIGNLKKTSYGSNNSANFPYPITYLTGTYVAEASHFNLGNVQNGTGTRVINKYLEFDIQGGFGGSNGYEVTKSLALGMRTNNFVPTRINNHFDLYIYKTLNSDTTTDERKTIINRSAAIYIEGKQIPHANSRESDLYNRQTRTLYPVVAYANSPWSLFAEGDRAYIGNTLALASALTLTSVTRGAWLDLGASQTTRPHINFSSGTAPTTPRTGDLWFDGSVLRFRLSSSTVNLTSGATITGGSIGSSEGSGVAVYKTTVGDTLQFRSLSSSNSSYISITQVGDLIVFSGGPGVTGLSLNDLVFTTTTTNGVSLFNTVQPYQIYYKNLSAGTGISLIDNGTDLVTISSRTNGTIISGANVGAGSIGVFSSVSSSNLLFRTLSAGTNTSISYAPDGTIVIRNTGVSGNTSFTGITDIVSAGTGNYSVISSVTDNKLVYRTLSAGTGMQITESNGTLVFVSTVTGGTGSGITGNFVPLTGTTYTSPMQGDLVFTGDTNTQVYNGIKTYYEGGGNTGYTFVNGAGITLGTTDGSNVRDLSISPSFNDTGTTYLNIFDTATASGSIVSVPDIAGNANKLIKVKSDELGFDFYDGGITYMDYGTVQAGGPFAPGQWYRIPVSSRTVSEGSNPNTYGDVMVLAVETGKTSPDGYLLAINADYQAVGDYTDTGGYTNNVGVGYNGLQIDTTTDVIIWDNRHWYPTGLVGMPYTITNLSEITSSCTPLPKDYTTRNGYIIEPQKIIYDVTTDTIKRMEDKRGNVVTYPNIEYFKFGHDSVYNNTVLTPQGFPISNFPTTNIQNNIINQGTISDLNLAVSLASNISLDLINCSINDVNFSNSRTNDLKFSSCTIQDGKIIKIGTNNVTITSSTLVLDNSNSNAIYEYIINATGGTFNGIITAITQTIGLVFPTRHRIYNNLTTGTITFKNGTNLKTEGGLDVILNRYDNVEFSYHSTTPTILRQTDINNYI